MSRSSIKRARRRVGVVATVAVVLLTMGVVVGGPAQARYALLPGDSGNRVTYKGCRVYGFFGDYGLGDRIGYGQAIVVKHLDGAGPKGCSLETDMEYDYWSSTLHRNVHDRLRSVFPSMPKNDVFFFEGLYRNQGLRVAKGSIAIVCRSSFDDCKTFKFRLFD